MQNSEELPVLTAEDIRYARNVDLSALTNIDPSNFAAWTAKRKLSERNMNLIAERLGMDKYEFMRGLEMKRADVAIAREVQAKFEKIIAARSVVA